MPPNQPSNSATRSCSTVIERLHLEPLAPLHTNQVSKLEYCQVMRKRGAAHASIFGQLARGAFTTARVL